MASRTTPGRLLLDVGGTFIKCGDGRSVPVRSSGSRQEIEAALREAVSGSGSVPSEVAVAIPGPFDYRGGTFLMKHKYASVYGLDFRELAGLPEGTDIRYMHDVNALLAGCIRRLSLQEGGCAVVTLGTGLGFSCAIQGRISCNEGLSPAVSLWNRPYGDGILEDRISARGITSDYALRCGGTVLSPLEISLRARAGEPEAVSTYSGTGSLLGEALRPLCEQFSLTTVLFGGQISKSLDLMLPSLTSALPGISLMASPDGAVFDGLETLFGTNE